MCRVQVNLLGYWISHAGLRLCFLKTARGTKNISPGLCTTDVPFSHLNTQILQGDVARARNNRATSKNGNRKRARFTLFALPTYAAWCLSWWNCNCGPRRKMGTKSRKGQRKQNTKGISGGWASKKGSRRRQCGVHQSRVLCARRENTRHEARD